MSPEETEIRAALKARTSRTGAEVWPELRRRIRDSRPRLRPLRWAAAAAILAGLALVPRWWIRPEAIAAPQAAFRVSRIQSDGRAADALVLCPDRRTVVVVIQ